MTRPGASQLSEHTVATHSWPQTRITRAFRPYALSQQLCNPSSRMALLNPARWGLHRFILLHLEYHIYHYEERFTPNYWLLVGKLFSTKSDTVDGLWRSASEYSLYF